MTYATALAALSRKPITLVKITLDYCARTFGVAPCTAIGVPCYNTYATCKDKTNFSRTTKDYKFTSADGPSAPFRTGERPYLKSIDYMPTEIKDTITVTARATIELYDEPDCDVGIDPYLSSRTPPILGTFWRKLLARNPNWKGRPVAIYEGFAGLAEGDYVQKDAAVIDNIELARGAVKIKTIDLLKSLDKIEVPAKVDCKLVADIDAAVTLITLSNITAAGLSPTGGYVRIGDEIIQYAATSGTTHQLTGCTRGAFNTVAAGHLAKDKVQPCKYYWPQNPFDTMLSMLVDDAEIPAGYVDSWQFEDERDFMPVQEINLSAIISEPTKLGDLYFELVELLDCKSWQAEDLKITIKRNIPSDPARTYTIITDAANIIKGSPAVDLNDKSRYTRIYIYWDKDAIGDLDDPASYARLDVAVDADAENANEYNEVVEKKIWCRWVRTGYLADEVVVDFITTFINRWLWLRRDAQTILSFSIDRKDQDISTGDWLKVSTDEMNSISGADIANERYQVTKREAKGTRLDLKLTRTHQQRVLFIAPDAAPDFVAATDAQKEYGYICGDTGLMADGTAGYVIF